jgi:uncharacterized protein (TIGR02246 family)
MRVNNPNRSPVGIHCCNAAPTPSGFVEIPLPKCRVIRHNSRDIMRLIERSCGLKVLSLAVIAGALVSISLPSEGQTGKSLSEADLRKIDDITQTAMNAALARDFATWAALFLDDAVVNPPNEPAVKGRAAIRAWLEKFPPMTEFKLNNEKVEGRDDLAYLLGTYTMTITPPGAPGPVKDSGKFVTVLRRQPDGRWLCAVDMFSSDLPPPPPTK